MGKTIEKLAKKHEIVLKLDDDNRNDDVLQKLKKADVAIEFSTPESAYDNIHWCLSNGIPTVSGTTGWLDKFETIKELVEQQQGAFIYASNFSIGVNLFFALNRQLAQWMNDHPSYDIDLKEIHHTQKKDAPSGTAISLARDIIQNISRKTDWHLTETESSPNDKSIPISSERIDPTPGTHTVSYRSSIDTIEIKHTAHSREGFAKGALLAAEWIVGKKGVYNMQDVLVL